MDFTTQKLKFQADTTLPKWVSSDVIDIIEFAQKAQERAKFDKIHIEKLTLELAYLRRVHFGAKTEAMSVQQNDLFKESFTEDIAAIEAELAKKAADAAAEAAAAPKPARPRAGRQPLPEHLPRIDIFHVPASCKCAACGKTRVKIGEDVTEKLTVQPTVFSVECHHYPKYACRPCETVISEPVAPAIIDGGIASTQLLVWIIVSKFVDHLPLYRLEQIGERQGVPLPRSNLAEWVGRVGVALQPLAARLAELLLLRSVIHADETPVAQLDPLKGKNNRSYLWAYRSNDLEDDPPIVVFDYQTGRSGSHARAFLEGWCGHLMVDDYSGYKALFLLGIIELGCMTHARRKFFDLHVANQSLTAAKALEWIGLLYGIERKGKGFDIAARKQLRHDESLPILVQFHEWLTKTRATVAQGSAIAKAIDYSLRRWAALSRYAQTGHLPIDNNPVENVIRPISLGRKNWMHYGSERAGHRAASIHTLMATAKLNGLDPSAWLNDVLEKLPTWPNSRLDELLPFRKMEQV